MRLLENVPVDRVLEAFRCDQKVQAVGEPWPTDRPGQVALLRKACRPVDYILDLTWGLYSLDRDELLSKVRTVWSRPTRAYGWTLGEMFAAYTAGRYKLEEPNTVSTLAADMRENFRESLPGCRHPSNRQDVHRQKNLARKEGRRLLEAEA